MYHEGEKLDEIHIYIYICYRRLFFLFILDKKSILMNKIDDIC